jgi:hypothetical protein
MADKTLRFDTIHIIESLDRATHGYSKRTGWHLYDEIQPLGIASKPIVDVQYHTPQDASQMLNCLAGIATAAAAGGHSPIVHFETHGLVDDDSGLGLSLADGSSLLWDDLRGPLTAINEIGHLHLLVLVAACQGFDLVKLMHPTERAPFRLVVGPNVEISHVDLGAACRAFYRTLFAGAGFDDSFRAMNAVCRDQRRPFLAVPAETMFKLVVRGYFEQFCSSDALARRTRRIQREALDDKQHLSLEQRADGLGKVHAFLSHKRTVYEQSYEKFFFCDRYPENRHRFAVSYEDCIAEP